jgi:hypothetical protein
MAQQCPVCRNENTVAKVSAIVASGTMHKNTNAFKVSPSFDGDDIKWSSSFDETSVRSHTELSKTLSLYPEGGEPDVLTRLGGLVLVLISGAMFYMLATQLKYPMPWGIGAVVVGIFLFLFVCGVALMFGGQTTKAKQVKEAWEELYYCFRDDVVYNPHSGRYRPRLKMKELLDNK